MLTKFDRNISIRTLMLVGIISLPFILLMFNVKVENLHVICIPITLGLFGQEKRKKR